MRLGPNSRGHANTAQLRETVVLKMELPAHLASALQAWNLAPVTHSAPIATELNNRSWHLFTSDGQYVLREHLNTTDPRRLAFEHLVLERLHAMELSFAVPWPLQTREGRTWTAAPDGPIVSLTRTIEGAVPDPTQPVVAQALGETLALLDDAMARLTAADPSTFVAPGSAQLPGASAPDNLGELTQDRARVAADA